MHERYDEYGTPKQRPRQRWPIYVATAAILFLLLIEGQQLIVDLFGDPVPARPVPAQRVTPAPTQAPDVFSLGVTAFNNRDYATAVTHFSAALEQTPDKPETFIWRADAHYNLGEYAAALRDYDRAVELAPSPWLYNNRGLTYAALREYDRAIADYTRAMTEDNGELHLPYNNRGLAYYDQGEYDAALADLNQALAIMPEYVYGYNNRALVYDALGQTEAALADYTRALELDPEYTVAYNNRALVYYYQGDYDAALADLNQALAINPDYAIAYNHRGLIYYEQEQYAGAIADYTRSLELNNPEPEIVYNNRGIAYIETQQYAEALRDFDRALELVPDYAFAYNNRGWARAMQDDHAAAIPDYERSLALGNAEPWIVYDNLAAAYYHLADYQRALAYIQQALAARDDYADAYKTQGDIYWAYEQYEAARDAYRRYLDLGGTADDTLTNRLGD